MVVEVQRGIGRGVLRHNFAMVRQMIKNSVNFSYSSMVYIYSIESLPLHPSVSKASQTE